MVPIQERESQKATTLRYLCVHILGFPFWGLLYLLPMILYKDLHATPFQVATIIALKPMASLISPYWSQLVHGRPQRLLPNLYWGNLLKFLPFLFVPVIQNAWYFVAAFGLFMMLSRGTIPAWMELLKINLPKDTREKICATGSIIDFLGTALLPIVFGRTLDLFQESWRWLFLGTALLGVVSTLFIVKIPKLYEKQNQKSAASSKNLMGHVFAPWKNCREILSKRSDFTRFQLGFFLGGAGLMIIQPVLPKFFIDHLHLSYTGMLTAIATCKGIGFTLSSPLWVRRFQETRIFMMCALVTGFAALFPVLLASAQVHHVFVYAAYLVYGVMQGGSELSWKMSGVVFSNNTDSSPYSSVNILAVGIRGLIVPYIGSWLFLMTGNYLFMMGLAAFFSIAATVAMTSYGTKTITNS